jgi:hypothetical protein
VDVGASEAAMLHVPGRRRDARALSSDEILVLRVAPDERGDERARRDDAVAAGAQVVERAAHEHRAEAAVPHAGLHLGVEEVDRADLAAVVELAGELVVDAELVAAFGRVVGDGGQQPSVFTVRFAMPFGLAPAYTTVSRA